MIRIAIVLLLMAAAICPPAAAQNINSVKERLAKPQTGENGRRARVSVNESGGAADAVRRGESSGAVQTANGFRIVIFFDNSPAARSEAERIMEEFTKGYPDIRCDIRYENPYFKVLAGNCITQEEAVVLLGRIKTSFPEAYIMREEIPVRNFITPEAQEQEDVPSDAEAADGRFV